MKYILFLLLSSIFFSCDNIQNQGQGETSQAKPVSESQKIVDKAREVHGSALVAQADITFNFRERAYKSLRDGGAFQYERIFNDSVDNKVRDILNNDGFIREVNAEKVTLLQEKEKAYANSVNSVLYFALLPYNLNDEAVNKKYLGTGTIKGENYHKIKITFGRENGGKDFEDEFVYFFHTEKNTMDYLAYNYLTDGGGARFREAYNQREISGILFSDFINYGPVDESRRDVENFDKLFEEGQLKELSRIDSEDVKVVLKSTDKSM